MADLTPAKRLFDLLVTRDFEVETLDSSGKANPDPSDAEIFSFDFTTSSGNNYGTVVIMYGEDNSLDLYTSDNVGRTMEGPDKDEWFAFQHQLKDFAMRNNSPSFNIKNINKLKYSMQGQAAIKEGLFESWMGNKHTSWNDKPEHVRLMIKHKRPIGEADARYRYIESLFVETSDGERFKLPFTKLSGGRAMCEHVRAGGKPYDARGVHIASIVEELNVLSRFRRANHGKVFEGDTAELINETNVYYETLHKILKGLGSKRGYTNYFECWSPATITEQELVVESIKNMFVRQSLDERIEEALPILARIQQQGRAMKEANIFESWANRLMEGTWATPETPEQKEKLVTMLSQELPVGADATNATEQLYDVLGDDVLFDQLENLADQDANADARQTILDRMQELADDPNVAEVIAQLNVDVNSTPEVDVDAEVTADETGVEQDVEEGTFRDEDGSADEDDLDEQGIPGNLPPSQVPGKEKLLKTPVSDTERALAKLKDLAHGVRGGKDVETFGSLKEEDLEEEEVRSGALSPFSEEEELDEVGHPGAACTTGNPPLEETTALQGQYGHSGRMQAVTSTDPDIMDRIRMLAGVTAK